MAKRSRKITFIAILVTLGLLLGGVVGAVLIFTGALEFGWTRSLRDKHSETLAMSRAHRVLVLGDSFLDWWPIQHSLRNDLGKFCGERNIGCINTAFGGFGPYEYAERMRIKAPTIAPGLTMLFFFAGNDLTDVWNRTDSTPHQPPADRASLLHGPRFQLCDSRLPPIAPVLPIAMLGADRLLAQAPQPAPSFDWDRMLASGVDPEIVRMAQKATANPGKVGDDYVNPYLIENALHAPDHFKRALLMEGEGGDQAWEKVKAELRAVRDLAQSSQSEFWIIVIPDAAQLDPNHHRLYHRMGYHVDPIFLSSPVIQDAMRKFCESEEIHFLDLLPALLAQPDVSALYWPNDNHFSEIGHWAAYQEVEKVILKPWWNANATITRGPE